MFTIKELGKSKIFVFLFEKAVQNKEKIRKNLQKFDNNVIIKTIKNYERKKTCYGLRISDILNSRYPA